jgi:hypothetical protein
MSEKPMIKHTSIVQWHDAATPPPVSKGGIGYFLVVMEAGKRGFGAHYLNEHLLQLGDFEDCPDAVMENGYAACESCEAGDGHRFIGWYEEKATSSDEYSYYPLGFDGIKLWAYMPDNPLANSPPASEVSK